jgi:hypothetical protein
LTLDDDNLLLSSANGFDRSLYASRVSVKCGGLLFRC